MTLLPNWTLSTFLLCNYFIPEGFYRTLDTGAASQQRTLNPTVTWSFLFDMGLAFVLMLRPFIPERFMSTDLLSFEHPLVLLFCSLDKDTGHITAKNGSSVATFLHVLRCTVEGFISY